MVNKDNVIEIIEGFSFSYIGSKIMPEIIHGFSVILFGILTTVAIHYTKKFLTKNK